MQRQVKLGLCQRYVSIVLTALLVASCSNSAPTDPTYKVTPPAGSSLQLGRGIVTSLSLATDGALLGVASTTGLYVYDLNEPEEKWKIAVTGQKKVAFSPDSSVLALGMFDGLVSIHSSANGDGLLELNTGTSFVSALAWSPSGEILATGNHTGTIALWDARTGKPLQSYQAINTTGKPRKYYGIYNPTSKSISAIAWSRDGRWLASGSEFGVFVWDIDAHQQLYALEGVASRVSDLTWEPDGHVLAIAPFGLLWNVDTDEIKSLHLADMTSDKPDFIEKLYWADSPDSIMAVMTRGRLLTWDHAAEKQLNKLDTETEFVTNADLTPDGTLCAIASSDEIVSVWNTIKGKQIASFKGYLNSVHDLKYSPDGTMLAAKLTTGVKVWDSQSGGLISEIQSDDLLGFSLAWSADSKQIAVTSLASENNAVIVLDVRSGQSKRTFKWTGDEIRSLDWSSDGSMIAAGGGTGKILIWDSNTGTQLQDLSATGIPLQGLSTSNQVNYLSFSPDSKFLATRSSGVIEIWDTHTGDKVLSLQNQTGGGWFIKWSPDGHILLDDAGDGILIVWDSVTGRQISNFSIEPSVVASMSLDQSNTTIAIGTWDGEVLMYDLKTSQELSKHRVAESDKVNSLDFCRCSNITRLAAGYDSGTIILWDVVPTP